MSIELSELYSTFFRGGVLGADFLGVLPGCFAGNFGAAARREWAVLPRNSGVFGWGEGAAQRFSARRTMTGTRGEKIFKNLLERGGKPKNWGCEQCRKVTRGHLYIGPLYRVRGAIFRRDL